jgi:hypothetical protein
MQITAILFLYSLTQAAMADVAAKINLILTWRQKSRGM